MKKTISLLLIIAFCLTKAEAYVEQYPPFPFQSKNAPPHLEAEELIGTKWGETIRVGSFQVETLSLGEAPGQRLRIKDSRGIIFETEAPPFPFEIYHADLDDNQLKDFLIFSSYHGCGLAGYNDRVDMLFQIGNHVFSHVHYDTMSANLKDLVDMNGDGVFEVIYTGFYYGRRHNYFVYNIYEIRGTELHNANKKYPTIFPKFIRYTSVANDKPTVKITREEKEEYLRTLPEVIREKGH